MELSAVRNQLNMLNASDIMTTEVISVKKDTSLHELAKILYENHINGVPVVDDDGLLVGIICESDLIRKNKKLHIPTAVTIFDSVLYLESPKKLKKELQRLNATKVEDLYTEDVFTVDEKTEIDEIATLMTQKKIYTIPVVDGNRIVGIIGKADLIRTIVP
jgi:CBS-domain-containing membrane protein